MNTPAPWAQCLAENYVNTVALHEGINNKLWQQTCQIFRLPNENFLPSATVDKGQQKTQPTVSLDLCPFIGP